MSRLANPEENVSIGRRLAGVREHRHLTQTEFAERLALSPRAYQNYERGEREIPAAVLGFSQPLCRLTCSQISARKGGLRQPFPLSYCHRPHRLFDKTSSRV